MASCVGADPSSLHHRSPSKTENQSVYEEAWRNVTSSIGGSGLTESVRRLTVGYRSRSFHRMVGFLSRMLKKDGDLDPACTMHHCKEECCTCNSKRVSFIQASNTTTPIDFLITLLLRPNTSARNAATTSCPRPLQNPVRRCIQWNRTSLPCWWR